METTKSASNGLFRRLCAIVLGASLLGGTHALAQTRPATKPQAGAKKPTATKPQAAPKKVSAAPVAPISGAWTGTISYTRTQSMSDSKTIQRVSGRGQDKTDWEMKYDYKAQVAVLEAPEKDGSSIGRASISHSFSSTEKISATEKNSCDNGKTWRDMKADSISKSETKGSASNQEANVTVGVNDDGTYTVSVGLSQIEGLSSGSQSSTFSGQCTPKDPVKLNLPATKTTIDGNSLTTDGTHRVNPSNPNRVSGSYSKTWQNVTETLTWNLQKGGGSLRLVDLKFEDMKFPKWNDWQEITEQKGTIDGNFIKIKAVVLNTSGESKSATVKLKETYKGDKWDGTRPDGLLEGGEFPISLKPGEQQEVELAWDSSGYSWYDDGRPRLIQRFKAELEEKGTKTDELTKNLKVAPKPVVLVHGLWSNWQAWETWQNILTTSHSYDWKAFPVGQKPEIGEMNTGGEFLSTKPTNSIFENSKQLGKYIRYAQEDRNAWHVDVVAHSMGGLISRHYIHQFMPAPAPDGRPQIAHLIQLGTPNMGSPAANIMDSTLGAVGKNFEAMRELREDVVAHFNEVNTNRKGVKFSVLAGDKLFGLCYRAIWHDGVVPVSSALWQIKDNARVSRIHTDLTGTEDFSGFVKPRLAIGPKGNHNPELPQFAALDTNRTVSVDMGAANKAQLRSVDIEQTDAPTVGKIAKPDFAKALTIEPKQTIEVDVPVETANNFWVALIADSRISATLINDKDEIISQNLTKTPEASAWVRAFTYDKPTVAATWKLKLENTHDKELEAIFSTWKNAVK